ncbi:FTR1 family protein [Micrococcales bacterium 31B]|nr:FTR1 family protein [Micrococcales bacterium 31B]
MLATFIIGLREGLEAALIVGIIAAFLRRNGRSLRPMALGVAAAVLLSIAVGVVLAVVQQHLPQAAQETMEAIIGLVAVVFVTTMVLWMITHARSMKGELEAHANQALQRGSTWALTAMAFLAVLKEGFETSVFLLATFSASGSAAFAATGAALGMVVSAALGYGIYRGGIRLNLAKFFSFTAAFLILVAAGLLVLSLRSLHEAGWLNAGQQRTVDLSAIAAQNSVLGALVTGVLGIPPDPRLIQVIAWFAYVIVVGALVYWPRSRRPGPAAAQRLRWSIAAALGLGAVALLLAVPAAPRTGPTTLALVDASGAPAGSVTLAGSGATVTLDGASTTMPLAAGANVNVASVVGARQFTQDLTLATGDLPATLTLTELVALNGGRLPAGMNAQRTPGPFAAAWLTSGSRTLAELDGQIVDFAQSQKVTLSVSGGGLASSRSVNISGTLPGGAVVSSSSVVGDPDALLAAQGAVATYQTDQVERDFWRHAGSLGLALAALAVAAAALWHGRGQRPSTGRPAPDNHTALIRH